MLLRTRFYIPPLRPHVVRRDGLLQRLQNSGGGSLLLVAAPAGYGKTTLISQWLHVHPHTFTWLSLGNEHNVITVFWHYTLTALQQILPDVGRDAERSLLENPAPDFQQMLVSLLNDLDQFSINNRASEPVTLVLDDFHVLHNERLLGLINLFLDHLPPCIRVVVTARSEPDLHLSRRRASGQLLQLGVDELRFDTAASCAFFVATLGPEMDAAWARYMCERTEGWIAGLQLAALSAQRTAADPSILLSSDNLDKHIADYLLDEVFAALPATLQEFLLHTAVVKRFCAGLCNAIERRTNSLQLLLELETLNLFLVPLDNHRTWFRYHDLFRQFLLQRFALLPEQQRHFTLANGIVWLEQNGYYDQAVELSLAHGCWHDATRLLTQDAAAILATDSPDQFAQWLAKLPAHCVAAFPQLQARLEALVIHGKAVESSGIIGPSSMPSDLIEPLTLQEKAVLKLIAQGLSNKAIASTLQISVNTLKVHIRNLYGKMGVENRTQALLRII